MQGGRLYDKSQIQNLISLKIFKQVSNNFTPLANESIIPIEVGKENIDKQATKFSPGNFSLNLSVTTGVIRLLILGDTT